MSKRRFISLLPGINQTSDLSNFFGATVDEVFQPGSSEALSGYIGHQPQNAAGFYISEPTAARAFYQLEPSMTSYDATATNIIDHALTYPDLVSYLDVNGANVSNHERLFETDYYAWAPPINIDMLVNYHDYYWFGDVSTAGGFSYGLNPSDRNASISLAFSNLTAWTPPTASIGQPEAIRSVPLPNGSWYVEFTIDSRNPGVTHYCGLANALGDISGLPGKQTGNNAIIFGGNGNVYNDTSAAPVALGGFGSGDVVGMAWSTTKNEVWFRVNDGPWNQAPADPATGVGGFDLTALFVGGAARLIWAGDGPNCTVLVNFGASEFAFNPPVGFSGPGAGLASTDLPTLILNIPIHTYLGDGSTRTFGLPNPINAVATANEAPTAYVDNIQVGASISGNNLVLNAAPALNSTVVVCRTPDFAAAINGKVTVDISDLNSSVASLTSTMRIKIVDAAHRIDLWDTQPWDETRWDINNNGVYMVDGVGKSIRLTYDQSIIRGMAPQYVTVDRSTYDPATKAWAQRNSWVHKGSFAWTKQSFPARRAERPIIEFIRDLQGYPDQAWSESIAPLFMLYDLNDHALDDVGYYPSSTFLGNRIFGYALGTSDQPSDVSRRVVVTAPQTYDNNGYVIFSNDAANIEYTYVLGSNSVPTPIVGLTQYAIVASDGTTISEFDGFWHLAAETTSQTLNANGFYDVPRNLQANPNYEDVSLISRSEWAAHFQQIITNQTGIVLDPTAGTSYRDTARDLTLGTTIVQHHAPLLKTMLMASDERFDLLRASRYVELEYTRFRNKFVRKLISFYNSGQLQQTDAASTWVDTILAALKIGHTNSFPFALSTMAGGQYFIPPTPTSLGIMPAAVPVLLEDHGVLKLLGHDGSLTPTFGDWRDTILLEMENRLYQNLAVDHSVFDIQRWISNFFYTASKGYAWDEVNAILAPMFELWAQSNGLKYRDHGVYDPNDPFTWNFRGIADRFGNILPGHWRAIYRFYYDTDAPDTRPWEMLGFVDEPSWWSAHYGVAPFARSNAMWHDLETGTIVAGPRAGVDQRYARPGLRDLIPVDANGNLLDPVAVGIVNIQVTRDDGIRDWLPGDGGPIEAQWRQNPAFRFAMSRAAFLMKPPRLVEQCWDGLNIGYVHGQWVMLDSLVRPSNGLQYVHGEIDPDLVIDPTGIAMPVAGVSQWIADYLRSNGQPSSVFGMAVRGLQVNLLHRMAGFVATETVQLVADSFGLLPNEDVQTIRYTSPAINTEVYSGVIVQWNGDGWIIFGYDARNPWFTIIPPNTNGPKGLISLAGASEPAIVPWRSGTYYPVQILVNYLNSVYECIRSHTSGTDFETIFWQARPDLSTAMIHAPRVVTYLNGLPTTKQVPYGTKFTSYQEIGDFLLGYERWLISRGWAFTNASSSTGQILNWSLSVHEFLSWAQVQWTPGNFIALSPGQQELDFTAPQGTILNVEDSVTGFYGLINRVGQPIGERDARITRLDGHITLAANNNDIFLARLEICNIEHALVPSNVTVFSDIVYLPLYDIRQERLLLTCNRATEWAGRLDAPGFIITDTTLKSNFDTAANDVRFMFDIEGANAPLLRDYARHNIGMQRRDYFNNLLMSPNTQFEFYQGMIKAKGSPGAFDKIARSTLASSQTSQLGFLEEWAHRQSVFGAPRNPRATFQLIQDDFRDEPQFIRFTTEAGSPLDWIQLTEDDFRWHDKPAINFFPEHKDFAPPVLPSAGPVRFTEVDYTTFDYAGVAGLYDSDNTLPTGTYIWTYQGKTHTSGVNWYVSAVLGVGNDSNNGTSITTPFKTLQHAHDLSNPGDTINIMGGAVHTINASLNIYRSGSSSAPITYRGLNNPIIKATQSDAILISQASFITITGIEIVGYNDVAMTNLNGSGIVMTPFSNTISVTNCKIHDFPYNGIYAIDVDTLTLDGNVIHDNGLYSHFAGNGINIGGAFNNAIITRNICYNNRNIFPVDDNVFQGVPAGIFIGGCGINIGATFAPSHTVVSNNLCYNNSGAGINVTDCASVDVIYNTASLNQTNLTMPLGEIVASGSTNCNLFNNIMVASDTTPITTNDNVTGVLYGNNLGFGGDGTIMPGLFGHGDPLFAGTDNFQLRRGSSGIGSANPKFLAEFDLAGNHRATAPAYDIGCYQSNSALADMPTRHPYDVLRSFDIGVANHLHVLIPNVVSFINTPTEDASLTSARVYFIAPFTLTTDDVGNYLVIDGTTNTTPDLKGMNLITAVHTSPIAAVGAAGNFYAIDIEAVGVHGGSFLTSPSTAPVCRVLRSMRFNTVAAINHDYQLVAGDKVWIEHYAPNQWAVMQFDGTNWNVVRLQPQRIDGLSIAETVIYSADAKITNSQMILNRPVVNDLDVIDPMIGLICGPSAREIDYQTAYDPATYNAGFGVDGTNLWGQNEVGMVWWNLATVRFVDPFTDNLGISQDRDIAELQYRVQYTAQVAPHSSVDVYEWVASPLDPVTYTANGQAGTVYNLDAPSWVEQTVYDPVSRTNVTMYYFWVSGLTIVPDMEDRKLSISTVAQGIVSPAAFGLAWMSAISTDGLLVGGVASVLDNTTTVMKVGLNVNSQMIGQHDEWTLIRPDDGSSLPSNYLWNLLRDSLAGFTLNGSVPRPLPDPALPLARNTGIDPGQSLFTVPALSLPAWQPNHPYFFGSQITNGANAYVCSVAGISAAVGPSGVGSTIYDGSVIWSYRGPDGARSGLMAARRAFVDSVNSILSRTPILLDRFSAAISILHRISQYNQYLPSQNDTSQIPYLMWSQIDSSYVYEAPPVNEYQVQVLTQKERNNLLTDSLLQNTSEPIAVLVNGIGNPTPQWSIWNFNPQVRNQVIANIGVIRDNPAWAPLISDDLSTAQRQALMAKLPPDIRTAVTVGLLNDADALFSLKPAYEHVVANTAQRDALVPTLKTFDRVLVTSDVQGFWVIWQYLGGFQLWRAQSYDTSTFIDTVNWYDTTTMAANGYSADRPPIVTYDTIAERNAVEGASPTNLFVAITNHGGDGIWTAFIDDQWVVVEIDNKTLQLSSKFYDPSRLPLVSGVTSGFGWDDLPFDNDAFDNVDAAELSLLSIGNRDGSWELRVLAHALRSSGLLIDSEINEIWFDMLNFIHTQQNEIDWAFKTSFMTVAGISEPMTQTPTVTLDQTANVVAYINEVKPYRVKVRDTTKQYTPDIDNASVSATDFDNPLYFDPNSQAYRPLDPTNDNDIAILRTEPWADWYNHVYLAGEKLGRMFTVTINFDRISNGTGWGLFPWEDVTWDTGENATAAAYRILTAYTPPNVDPNDAEAVMLARFQAVYDQMGLAEREAKIVTSINYGYDSTPLDIVEFDGSITAVGLIDDGGSLDGSSTYDIDINPPQISRPGGYDLRAPYYAANHPEERVVVGADDSLQMTVTASPLPGAPPQTIKVFETAALTGTATLYFAMIAQANMAVAVYRDGVRATLGTDYTVDYFARTVTVNLPAKRVLIHAFGFGASSAILEQHYLTYGTNPLALTATTDVANVAVIINGVQIAVNTYHVSGRTVTLDNPPSTGAAVVLVVFQNGSSTATQMHVQSITYTSGNAWTISSPDAQTQPPHAGVIVEVNGRRLTPPTTFYGSMAQQPWVYLPLTPTGSTTLTVYVDNVLYSHAIPYCTATPTSQSSPYPFNLVVPTGQTPPTNIAGQFVIFQDMLVALDTKFASSNIAIVTNQTTSDYTVSSNGVTLNINSTLHVNDVITITTFANAAMLGIQTVTYAPNATGNQLVPLPVDQNYGWVTMNGLRIAPEDDYTIAQQTVTGNLVAFKPSVLTSLVPITGILVATIFTKVSARRTTQWLYTTTVPSRERMIPAIIPPQDGFDDYPFGLDFGHANGPPQRFNGSGPVDAPLFSIDHGFETIMLSPYRSGVLVADLAPTDTSFEVSLMLQPLAEVLQGEPLSIPDVARLIPGVVWLDNERIEYFGYEESNGVATLSALRRATRGTTMGAQRIFFAEYANGTNQPYVFPQTGAVDVMINGQTIANNSAIITISVVSGTTTVTVAANNGDYVVVGLATGVSHFSGTSVWNGQIPTSDVPVTPPPRGTFGWATGQTGSNPAHSIAAAHSTGHVTGHGTATAAASSDIGPHIFTGPTNLGTFGAQGTSTDASVIVGQVNNGGVHVAGWWNGLTITNLPLLAGDSIAAIASSCSSNGAIIVGTCTDTTNNTQAVYWQSGTIHQLPFIPGGFPVAMALACSSNGLIIVGAADDALGNIRAVVWNSGTLTQLSTLVGAPSNVTSMAYYCSDSGSIIVGSYNDPVATVAYAGVWNSGVLSTLPFLSSNHQATAYGCSADGSIVVGSALNAGNHDHAVYWQSGSIHDLGLLPGGTTSVAVACSADGSLIVGSADDKPVVWQNGIIAALPLLSGYVMAVANGVSRDGTTIVGVATDSSGNDTAIKWT